MSLRRDSNREPAPVPASVATDRLSAVLHAGLRFATSNTAPVATATEQEASLDAEAANAEWAAAAAARAAAARAEWEAGAAARNAATRRKAKVATALRFVANAHRDILNSNEDHAIRFLNSAKKTAREIKEMQPQDATPRAPTQPSNELPPSGTGDGTASGEYLATRTLASWYAHTASQRFVDDLIDDAIQYLKRATIAVQQMKKLKVDQLGPLHSTVYSSDDGLFND